MVCIWEVWKWKRDGLTELKWRWERLHRKHENSRGTSDSLVSEWRTPHVFYSCYLCSCICKVWSHWLFSNRKPLQVFLPYIRARVSPIFSLVQSFLNYFYGRARVSHPSETVQFFFKYFSAARLYHILMNVQYYL